MDRDRDDYVEHDLPPVRLFAVGLLATNAVLATLCALVVAAAWRLW